MIEIPEAELIRRRMERVRHHLDEELDGVVSSAHALMNWRTYVRQHPGLFVGVAAAGGFLLASRISAMVRKTNRDGIRATESRQEESGRARLGPSPPAVRGGAFLGTLGMMVLTAAVRAAISHAAAEVVNTCTRAGRDAMTTRDQEYGP